MIIRRIMLAFGYVPLAQYGRLHDKLAGFAEAAQDLQSAHVDLMARMNEWSMSVYGIPLDASQTQMLADIKHAQGRSEAKAERVAQVFELDAYRNRKNMT